MNRKKHDISFCFDRIPGVTRKVMEGHYRQNMKEHEWGGKACADEFAFSGSGVGEAPSELKNIESYLGGTDLYVIGQPSPEKERTRARLLPFAEPLRDSLKGYNAYIYQPIDPLAIGYDELLVLESRQTGNCTMIPLDNDRNPIERRAKIIKSIKPLRKLTEED